MDGKQFDQLTRVLAGAVPRRGVLKVLVGGLLGGSLTGLRTAPASAACNPGELACSRTNGQVQCCPSPGVCCATRFGDEFCYDPATRYCSDGCGPLSIGSTCCIGANNGATSCPPNYFCCPLDTGNQTCCPPGAVCDPTFTCRAACPVDRVQCGQVCCRTGETCDPATGNCRAGCPSGQTLCNGVCVDTNTNDANCGTCGNVCTGDTTCQNGICACPSGQEACGATCCDGTCLPDATCCPTGREACGAQCCPPGDLCVDGVCCPLERACAGTCCPAGQRCLDGRCVKDPDYCNQLPSGPERAACHRETSGPPGA